MRNYDDVAQYGWDGLSSELAQSAAGDVFYVDANASGAANNATSGQGDSWASPFSTVNYAVSRCTNDGGNVIFVAADHTESITSTATASGDTANQFVIDKSGVTIIGLGTSDRRPTFSFSGAVTAEVYIVATEVTLKNLLFKSAIIDLETLIEAVAGSGGLLLENCEFRDGSNVLEAMDSVSLAADVDDVVIRGCRFITTDTATSTQSAIMMAGGSDRSVFQDNYFYGDWGGGGYAVIEGGTAASVGILIDNNVIYNTDATKGEAITMHGDTTGFVINNTIYTTNAYSSPIIAAKCVKRDNKVTSVLGCEAQPQGSDGAIANGNHFYVDAGTGVDTATGLSWHDPVATIDVAIALCTNAYGDIIHVAKGHTENVAAAGITCDITHMSIIGEGTGEERPFITFITNATAAVTVTADAVRLENLRFGCNVDIQNHMIDVDGDDCEIINCEFVENGQTGLSAVTADTTGGAGHGNNLLIQGCRFYFPTAGNMDNAIDIGCDIDEIVIKDNYVMGDFDEAGIEIPAGGNNCQDINISGNIVINEQAGIHCIEVEETALTVTGICSNNFLVCSSRVACLKPNILNCFGNYWSSVTTRVAPVALEGDITTPGQNIYVNSAHTNAVDDTAHGGSWDYPLALIEYANTNRMTANNNDIIHVGPGHEEVVTDAAPLAFDTAGVTVLGYGTRENMPKITLDTNTTAVCDIGADGVVLKHLLFRSSIDAVAVGVDILDGFEYCEIIDCDFGPAVATTDEFAICLQVGAASDYAKIIGCKFENLAAANVCAIKFNGTNDHAEIADCVLTGASSTCQILGATTATTYSNIHHNTFITTGGTDTFNLVAASTGMIHDNRIVMNAANVAAALDVGNCWCMENYFIADDDVGGAKGGLEGSGFGTVTVTADDP